MFEGSTDGKEYVELFKVDENVHEGWNYFKFEKGKYPNYRYYRFRGLGRLNGPCRIGEIRFQGNEVIENNDSTYDCPAELVMKGEDNVVLNKPKYDGTVTPLLEKMEPRFGSVVGGEDVTFSGKNFNSDPA